MKKTDLCKICLISLLVLATGCSSKLIIKSEPPDADVYYRRPDSDQKLPIGKTPLELTTGKLRDILQFDPGAGTFYEIVVEKQDYATARFLIPAPRMGTIKTTLDARLQPGPQEGKIASNLVQFLFNAQKFANKAEFERAQIELDKALTVDPKFARALSMRGTIYFLQHQYTESLKWLEQAVQADPQLDDAVRMIAEVRKVSGDTNRYPASDANQNSGSTQ